jgi:hypothetical protein
MNTDRKIDDPFRQHRRVLQTIGRWLEPPEKVQQQSAATAPTETGLRATRLEPLTCATDPQRPSCLQMVRRRSTVRFRNGTPAQRDFFEILFIDLFQDQELAHLMRDREAVNDPGQHSPEELVRDFRKHVRGR